MFKQNNTSFIIHQRTLMREQQHLRHHIWSTIQSNLTKFTYTHTLTFGKTDNGSNVKLKCKCVLLKTVAFTSVASNCTLYAQHRLINRSLAVSITYSRNFCHQSINGKKWRKISTDGLNNAYKFANK